MKTKDTFERRGVVYSAMFVLLTVLVATPFLSASAQSARGDQTPSAISLSQSATPSQSALEPSYLVDPSADKYKLIFASRYEGKGPSRSKKPNDDEAFVQVTSSKLDNFVEQLNQAGAQGYKLVSAIYGEGPIGVVKLAGVQYEYDWVMTDGVGAALRGRHERLSKGGFRLVGDFELTIYCVDDPSSPGGEYCKTKSVLLLEMQKDAGKPTPYALLWQNSGARLTDELKQKLAEGFFPTYLFSDYQLLVEQTEKKDERFTNKQDVRAVIGSNLWSGNPSKSKINELAKHGYRLALINSRIALLYKDGETASPVTYVWLHITTKKNWKLKPRKRKDFEEKLADLQASGGAYRMIYRDNKGYNQLIFEQTADDGKRRDYKVLTFDFQVNEDAAAQKFNIELAPASKETMKSLNSLAKEGFVVRDLFVSDGYNVILERTP